ncbi:MAG TPA: acetoacetate--CoA ligase [Legionellaceae bacterium]|nr:acetoacetate--CoA ligase [Legionellaceae bacterium]
MTIKLWQPTHPESSQLWQFMQSMAKQYDRSFSNYQSFYEFSLQEPKIFWPAVWDYFHLQWDTPPTQILNDYDHMLDAKWFQGATFNFAQQLLRRRDEHPALVTIDELGRRKSISYHELHQQVAACAAGLRQAGIQPLDRVAGIMPNVAYTIIAMLATASIGAIWSSCSPDFGAAAIVDRLGQIEPKLLFVANGHTYQGKSYSSAEKIKIIQSQIPSLTHTVIYAHLPNQDTLPPLANTIPLEKFIIPNHSLHFVSLPFDHPLYILFSSGTTGKPKCIVHGAGGTLLQHVKELGLHCDISTQDNMLFYTTCGWMMWNWMASTLALGATLTLYEGCPSYPNAQHLFSVLDQEQITIFGTGAKFIAGIEKNNLSPKDNYALQHLRLILSTGSPLMPHHFDYITHKIKANIPVSSISGGTDIISCFALGNPILPVYSGELQCIGLGMAVQVLDDHAHPVIGQQGELVCTQAFPSMPVAFWNDPDRSRYKSTYFEQINNVWVHGDYAEITPHHGLIIYGRSDSTLKPGGVRIGTAEIYRQIETLPEILDAVVIGQNHKDDIRIVLFVKLLPHITLDETLQHTIREVIRKGASPRHVPAIILQVKDIPHTINGKLVELAVRQIVHGLPVKNIDSIANPEALAYFKDRIELQASQ